jgi:hypothetical protein
MIITGIGNQKSERNFSRALSFPVIHYSRIAEDASELLLRLGHSLNWLTFSPGLSMTAWRVRFHLFLPKESLCYRRLLMNAH